MRVEQMVGLARVVLFRRERLMMLEPRDKGIAATTLRFANEVHASVNYFDEIPDAAIPKEMLELAKHIIEKMTGKFQPEEFQDRYENAVIELIRSKQKGLPIKPQPTHRQANVINLMDALRRSVEGAKGGAAEERAGGTPRASAKKPPADRRAKGKPRIKKAG
jgi:DNA end-binding protein Ku